MLSVKKLYHVVALALFLFVNILLFFSIFCGLVLPETYKYYSYTKTNATITTKINSFECNIKTDYYYGICYDVEANFCYNNHTVTVQQSCYSSECVENFITKYINGTKIAIYYDKNDTGNYTFNKNYLFEYLLIAIVPATLIITIINILCILSFAYTRDILDKRNNNSFYEEI